MTTTPVGSPTFPGSDINGDGHVDIFWRHTTAGQTSLWNMENETLAGGKLLLTVPTFWNLAGAADFTGDGVTDLLWRNNNTSMVALWEMNLQGDYVRSIPIRQLPLDWQPVGLAILTTTVNPIFFGAIAPLARWSCGTWMALR